MTDLPLSPDGATAPPVPPLPSKGQRELRLQDIGRFLYTHNPFYAISASLVFWGLQSSFDLHIYTFQTFAMMGGLVGYTLVLSLAAFVVIRFGKVWDDGRSLLFLVILMLLAISVSFDVALARNPRIGTLCCVGGLLFSALVTEGLLRGLAIRLPALFRLPYYLLLGLFFLYPVALRWTLSDDPDSPGIQWALLAFPSLAGILCLSLLPAVRRGPQYVRDNGTPWPWPWYPWTLFFVLGLGVCGRSYYLCMSMHQTGGFTTIFTPYFVVPLLLAANVLLLEGGLVARSVAAMRIAMIAPAGLILLAMVPPSGKASVRFLHEVLFGMVGAGPLFLTTLAVATFYGWAILRRVSYAVEALSAVLLILSVVGPKTVNGATICVPPRVLPILVIGVIQVLLALRRPSAPRWFVAVCCAVVGATLAFRETAFMAYHGIIPAHLMLGSAMLLGTVFSGRFARFLQHAGAVFLLVGAVAALTVSPIHLGDVPLVWLFIYPVITILVASAYGLLVRNWLYFASAAATVACWLGVGSLHGYRQLRPAVSGLDYIVCGALSLIVAMLISLGKAGFLQWRRLRHPERKEQHRVSEERSL
jgi:hypothetical protein